MSTPSPTCAVTWPGVPSVAWHPLAARHPHLELYIRWMQEVRWFKPSTVSRRFSVAAGFYKTCVIDGLVKHSPAEHVRRPSVPAESPTLGFTHLQFEALLTAARESSNPCDFALIAMLGLLGLRIFEATGAGIADVANIACSSVVAGPLSTTSGGRVPVSATTSSLASRVGAGRRDLTQPSFWISPATPEPRKGTPMRFSSHRPSTMPSRKTSRRRTGG